jgi:hypothetical protein
MKYAIVLLLAMSSMAFAEDVKPAAPPKPPAPCERGASTIKLGGVDLDEIRCLGAIEEQKIAQQAVSLASYEATIQMLTNDLKAETSRAEKAEKDLADLRAKAAQNDSHK